MKKALSTLLAVVAGAIGCSAEPDPVRAGALYSVTSEDGAYFQVVKVLAVDPVGVHIRLYKNRFTTRPATVNFGSLSLGSIRDADGFGMGHLPLTHRAFAAWTPIYIADHKVEADELAGYEEWQSAQGGYFGSQ